MPISGAVIGGLSLGLFMAISVGPTLFAVIRYSLNHSYRAGLAFVLGVSVSDIIYVTLANLATPWLETLYTFEKYLAYGGGALLAGIGLVGLLKKYKPKRPSPEAPKITNGHYFRIAVSGFFINSFNPGVIINWLAAVTIIAPQPVSYRVVFFTCCLGLVLGVDVLKVLLADRIRRNLTLRKVMYLQKISAFCLLAAGLIVIIITLMGVSMGKH